MTEPMRSTIREAGCEDREVDGVVAVELGSMKLGGIPGVLWGLDSPQLNVNFVSLGPGDGIGEHVSGEVDQLIVVQVGAGVITVDGREHAVVADSMVLIPRGSARSIRADRSLGYLSIHVRRPGVAQLGNQSEG